MAPVSSLGRAPQVLAPARTLPPRRGKLDTSDPWAPRGWFGLARPLRLSSDRGRENQASQGEGVPVRVVVGAGLPSLVPCAWGLSLFLLKNAKVPSRVPRDLVGPITARLELTSRWLEEASLRGRRSHSRPPHSHLLRPRVAGRDFPPGNTSGSLSTLLPGTVPGGRWPEGPPTLRTQFSFTPFRARLQTHLQLNPNPTSTTALCVSAVKPHVHPSGIMVGARGGAGGAPGSPRREAPGSPGGSPPHSRKRKAASGPQPASRHQI